MRDRSFKSKAKRRCGSRIRTEDFPTGKPEGSKKSHLPTGQPEVLHMTPKQIEIKNRTYRNWARRADRFSGAGAGRADEESGGFGTGTPSPQTTSGTRQGS